MSKHPFSRYFIYQEMTAENSAELQKLAISLYSTDKKLPSVFGGCAQENQKLAKAYSENKELYPYSYLIFDKSTGNLDNPIGCLIAQKTENVLDTAIVLTGEHSHFQTIVVLGEFQKFICSEEEDFELIFSSDDERVMEILGNYGLLSNCDEETEEES